MKEKLKKIIGNSVYQKIAKTYRFLVNLRYLVSNYFFDMKQYYKYSNVFKKDTFEKIEAHIILDYHAIEKGFLHNKIRPRFAIKKVKNLISNLEIVESKYKHSSQTLISYKVLCDYYDYHKNESININEYFSEQNYNSFKSKLEKNILYEKTERVYITKERDTYFSEVYSSFDKFSSSRKSIRSFSEEIINDEVIKKCIQLASNSPSVCNRQSSKVYFIKNKEKIKSILDVQGGLVGFQDNINNLIVLTVDRNFFYTIGERNQFFIDGGIYLMNLMYALHFHKIASCPANWGKMYRDDLKAEKILNLKKSEKIICVLAIGYIKENVNYTLSKRRTCSEVLVTI
jgi:nitroreductase